MAVPAIFISTEPRDCRVVFGIQKNGIGEATPFLKTALSCARRSHMLHTHDVCHFFHFLQRFELLDGRLNAELFGIVRDE